MTADKNIPNPIIECIHSLIIYTEVLYLKIITIIIHRDIKKNTVISFVKVFNLFADLVHIYIICDKSNGFKN